MSQVDKEGLRTAYEDVRSDDSETAWAVFKYNEDNMIAVSATGTEYDAMLETFGDDERAFAYVRVYTGDELSKRAKFALLTWIGTSVGALKRAKTSTDKSFVKQVIPAYGKEFLADDKAELAESVVKEELAKAGGANYGTGSR